MAMLAEPRQRKRYNLVPRGKALYEDDSRFGTKMLEKMGWSKGKGLGANEDGTQDFVRVRYKNDIEGLGFEQRDDQWTQHESSFNGLLKTLNGEEADKESKEVAEFEDDVPRVGFGFQNDEIKQEAKTTNKSKLKEKISGISLEERSKQSRARVHYKKFTKGKDLSQYSETDLANIFGKKAVDVQETAVNDLYHQLNQNLKGSEKDDRVPSKEEEGNGKLEKFGGVQTISTGLSVADYFKMKMAALKSRSEHLKSDSDTKHRDVAYVKNDSNEDSIKKKKNKKRAHENDDFIEKQVQSENVIESEAEVVTIEKKKEKKKKKNKELDPDEQKKKSAEECIPCKDNLEKATNENHVQSDNVIEYEAEVITIEKKKEKKKKKNKELDPDEQKKKSPEDCIEDRDSDEKATNKKKKSKKRKLENGISNQDDDEQHPEKKDENVVDKTNPTIKSTKYHNKREKSEDTNTAPMNIDTEKPIKEKEQKSNVESSPRCQVVITNRKTQITDRKEKCHPKKLLDVEKIKNLSLQELKESIKAFNVFNISSFCAEKFRNINLNFFPSSNLSQIEGYGISEDIELSVSISKKDELRITKLWENNLNKYQDVSMPRKSYAKYVREVRRSHKTKTKRPKLKVKMWKNKNVFSII